MLPLRAPRPATRAAAGSKGPVTPVPAAPSGANPWRTGQCHALRVGGPGRLGQPLDQALLQAEYVAGIRVRLIEIAWNNPITGPGGWDAGKAQFVQQRIDILEALGSDVNYPRPRHPVSSAWATAIDPLVDQYGNRWGGEHCEWRRGDVYWSPTLRARNSQDYVRQVFTHLDFHGRLWAVARRAGGAQTAVPESLHPGQASFWAFDATAQAQSPVPGWRPGQPSSNGEAGRFYEWYVDNLANYFNSCWARSATTSRLRRTRHAGHGMCRKLSPGWLPPISMTLMRLLRHRRLLVPPLSLDGA